MKRILVILALMLASPAAHALDEDALLVDYIGLTKLLRANGVDPVQVSWHEVEGMCLPLKTMTSQLDYNRCRFQKALDQVIYRDDAIACRAEANGIRAGNLYYHAADPAIFPSVTVGSNVVVSCANSELRDINAFRRYSFDRCMDEKGWRSSRNYRYGMRH